MQPGNVIFHQLKVFLSRFYKLLIIILLLIIIYFSYNPIYINFFLHVGKPAQIGGIQDTNQTGSYYFDKFQETRYDGQETYQLVGWAFPKELNRPLADYQKQILLIDDHSIGYYFDTMSMVRADVTLHYTDLGINLDQSGYLVNISKYVLPKGKYNIAFLFSLSDGSEPILFHSNKYVIRTPNNLELIQQK